jgi:hypothetical protein
MRRSPLSVNRIFVQPNKNPKFTEERNMKNWHEYRNFKKVKSADGSYSYFIIIEGEDVEVSEEIYTVYAQGAYKMDYMENGLKRDRVKKDADSKAFKDASNQIIYQPELETSLEKLMVEDWEFCSPEPLLEDAVIERLEIERILNLLDADERSLVTALFIEELTEREYSEKTGLCQKTVNNRKHKILGKLKDLLKIA